MSQHKQHILNPIVLGITTVLAGSWSSANALENMVTVESRAFLPGQIACSLGISLENANELNDLMLPLEFRTESGAAYVSTTPIIVLPAAGRLSISQGGPEHGNCEGFGQVSRSYATPSGPACTGPSANSYSAAAPEFDLISPDCLRFSRACDAGEPFNESTGLFPGSDEVGRDNASLAVVFDVGNGTGTFIIDTVCVNPGNRLLFVHNDHGDVLAYTPAFVAGVVTIECGPCRCHADPNCDGVVSIVDVVTAIGRAFRGEAPRCTPYVVGGNPTLDGPTDVDCSGATDVGDVVRLIGVAFQAADPSVEFCHPCP